MNNINVSNRIFKINFPNTLRIVRRKVTNDEAIRQIDIMLKRIDNFRDQKTPYLSNYLKNARRVEL